MAKNICMVTLIEHYFHALHFNKGSVNGNMIKLLHGHLFNVIDAEKYYFRIKYCCAGGTHWAAWQVGSAPTL